MQRSPENGVKRLNDAPAFVLVGVNKDTERRREDVGPDNVVFGNVVVVRFHLRRRRYVVDSNASLCIKLTLINCKAR